MTLKEARQLIWQAERVNLTVLAIYAQPNRPRDYLFVIERVEGDKLIFADAMKAHIALAVLSGKHFRENFAISRSVRMAFHGNATPKAG